MLIVMMERVIKLACPEGGTEMWARWYICTQGPRVLLRMVEDWERVRREMETAFLGKDAEEVRRFGEWWEKQEFVKDEEGTMVHLDGIPPPRERPEMGEEAHPVFSCEPYVDARMEEAAGWDWEMWWYSHQDCGGWALWD